jgi:hypothetical protein
MDTQKPNRIGTREDVFKGLALRTAGGLTKDDIIEKKIGQKTLYISKKLSEKMKTNFNIIRSQNPNHLKRIQKRTISNLTRLNDTQQTEQTSPQSATQNATQQTIQQLAQKKTIKKQHQPPKTHKISFKQDGNVAVNVYYPELKGMNIKELKEELIREEMEEDIGMTQSGGTNKKKEFVIEDVDSLDLDKDLFD